MVPVAADNIGGTLYQRIKVTYGDDGSSTDASASNPLPVTVSSLPAASVSTDALGAAPLAETTLAGATPYKLNSAASTNATSVKGSVGKVYSILLTNTNAAVRYVKFYNKATAPTVGSDTPVLVIAVPGNTAGAGVSWPLGGVPLKFSTGIALAITTGAADADTGAVAANEIIVNLGYV